MLTRLQAINNMLVAVGEQVILVEQSGAGDYANASAILDAETLKVLAKGCAFNTDRGIELSPDEDGKIAVPSNVLQIDPVDDTKSIVQRGGFLYDLDAQTDVFAEPLKVDRILSFDFEDVPFHIQNQIVARATQKYQRSYVGSAQLDTFLQEERGEAGADAADAEVDSDDFNILNNPELAYLRRRSYRRNI